uniref:Protein FAM161A n=1 Tax=Kryptolebias marmoratus TaxID=37003 RepID=A0A3Q2ZR17_KRYMA
MANAHRTNVLVTSCLKTPVDPHTKAPLASYERGKVLGHIQLIIQNFYLSPAQRDAVPSCKKAAFFFLHRSEALDRHPERRCCNKKRLDLSELFFSNEEYYGKLDELKRAHRHTMAELESMYEQKLRLKSGEPFGATRLDRPPWTNMSPAASRRRLRKSHSAVELRWGSGRSDSSDENEGGSNDVEKGLLFSPKEYIKNMWKDFKVSPHNHHLSSSSLHSLPADQRPQKRRGHKDRPQESRKHRVTVPKPFHMTLREAERQKHGMKTRSEVEVENAELRRQLEELTECQRQFRASPVPAHVHLPLYEELQERNEERRRAAREQEQQQQHLRAGRKPFSFLERERLKKEQKQQRQQPPDQEKVKPFKAKPVPKSVYAAASGEQMKEEQLYRSIKIQMRAEEMLHSASMPPSMLSRRLSERKKTKRGATGEDGFSYKPQINKEVPDFNATYKRFQKQLEKRKEVKPTTACEPFELRTSHILSHRERILADIEKDRSSPRMLRWPCSPGPARTPNSSLCSSLSGSMEVLPAKDFQRRKEYQQEIQEMRARVKGRPLLLEQVAQVNVAVPHFLLWKLCFLVTTPSHLETIN